MTMLEREHSLADLSQWLVTARVAGLIALVWGEAGVGKTTLLQEFARRQREVRVLWGSCDALFTPRPLAPLHDIARQTPGPLLTALTSGASRDVIFSLTLDELERAPALLVFEDMHWADDATLDLLKYLGRRIERTHSLLVLTYRDDEVGSTHPLRFVIGDLPRARTQRMMLPPLSETAVAQLASEAGRSAVNLHSITGGNPLFVTEVLAAAAGTIPATVRDAVLARAVRLSPAAREIAELVCVVPGKLDAWILNQAIDADDASIESCLSIGMVRDDDGALAFRHELTRRAFESSLSPLRQQKVHTKVLNALMERSDTPTARLAHHADGARDPEQVLHFAPLAAAHALSVGAHREAASHLKVALQYAHLLPVREQASLHEQLSYECYLTDQIESAIDARTAALTLWQGIGSRLREGDTLRWLSRLSWFAGRRNDANRYGAAAVTVLETLAPGPELAMAYSNRAQLDMLAHEVDSAIQWAKRTIALAEPWANDEILSHALNNLGSARVLSGDEGGWADLERSLALALAGGLQEHVARAYTNIASMAVCCRQYVMASSNLNAGIAYCVEHDLASWRLYMLAWSARAKFEQGDWQGAAEDADIVLQHPRTAPISRLPALTVLGHLRLRRGDPDAQSPLEAARALAGPIQELQRSGPLAIALAESAWLADDHERVVRELECVYQLAQTQRAPWMQGELASWLSRVKSLDPPPVDVANPYRLEFSNDWRQAAQAWNELGCPYEHASVLMRHGGEPELREALAIFEHLGAAPMTQATRRALRAQGVRGIPRGARASTRTHAHGLTKREAQILDLLSEGLRNSTIAERLYLATKTVDHHVSAILMKLGVTSRAGAVAMARRTATDA